VTELLARLPSPHEGGYRANDRIPVADLLSTFTATWTLHQLGCGDAVDWRRVLTYVESLEQPRGGFTGGLWDESPDIEYTFYGLGTLGLAAGRPK
jgi:geranylgeranyl transferase type-2 subunit beta